MRQAAIITALAVLLSAGLIWLVYLWHTLRVANTSPIRPSQPITILVFGSRLRRGAPNAYFSQRLARALALTQAGDASRVLLLGGHTDSGPSEAAVGARWLQSRGLPSSIELMLEEHSLDTLQNLQNARRLLQGDDKNAPLPPVGLVTSRYHLARCLMLARRLGLDATPVAAEPRLVLSARQLRWLWLESGYLMWIDLGVRFSQLTGGGGMASRIS